MNEERKREREEMNEERKREREEKEKAIADMKKSMLEQHEREMREEKEKLQSRYENEARTEAEDSNPFYHLLNVATPGYFLQSCGSAKGDGEVSGLVGLFSSTFHHCQLIKQQWNSFSLCSWFFRSGPLALYPNAVALHTVIGHAPIWVVPVLYPVPRFPLICPTVGQL
ncbi:hypothetical protein Q8A73_003933 [Channa argus]|nr:hypothetical protein Q8A73_003933 [Channa argus]